MPNAVIERAARHHVKHLRAVAEASPDAFLSPDAYTLAPLLAAHANAVADLLEYYLDVEGGVDGIWAVRVLLKEMALGLPGGQLWAPAVEEEGAARRSARTSELSEVISVELAREAQVEVPAEEPSVVQIPEWAPPSWTPPALPVMEAPFGETEVREATAAINREAWAPVAREVVIPDPPARPVIERVPSGIVTITAPTSRAQLRARRSKKSRA